MSRSMIEIVPGTENWDAWIEHHRGSKTELVMVKCRHDARPFYAWSEMPPEHVRSDRLSRVVAPAPKEPERGFNVERDVEAIATRLEQRDGRNREAAEMELERLAKLSREAGAFGAAVDAVRSGQTPNLRDLPDVGLQMIDDPFEVRRGRKPKPLRAKLVNLRDDPIGQMAKRGQIEAEQLQAARQWQALYDIAASVGGARGIDPSAMKVDGGRFSEPINDAQFGAMKRLQKLDRILGSVGASIVRCILGERMSITQLAAFASKPGMTPRQHQTERERLGARLGECLDTLIVAMCVEAKGRGSRSPRDEIAELARYADNPLLYNAVHEALRKIV